MPTETPALANETLCDLTLTRIFHAPPALVFEAFTNPEHLSQWLGPRGFTALHVQQDLRRGGKWSAVLHQVVPEWQGRIYPDLSQHGVFLEILPPERLVYTFAWGGEGGQPTRETVITVTFAPIGSDRTEMHFHQEFFDNVIQRDGHAVGWTSSFDRLNDFLNRTAN